MLQAFEGTEVSVWDNAKEIVFLFFLKTGRVKIMHLTVRELLQVHFPESGLEENGPTSLACPKPRFDTV